MGSTFGAVHIKGQPLSAARVWIDAELSERGYVLKDDDAPAADDERRVLVFERDGWAVVADEDLLVSSENLGQSASAVLETDVLVIGVEHSDVATLERFTKGEVRGRVTIPEDATSDDATGRDQVRAPFLADLATSKDERARLENGVVADRTFPEHVLFEITRAIGLPDPGAGAAYLWNDPPEGAVRLRFAPPETGALGPEMSFGFVSENGEDLRLAGATEFAAPVGMPLRDGSTFTLEAFGGERIVGLAVTLGGPGLALLDVEAVAAWNPDITRSAETKIEEVAFANGRAVFPTLHVAPSNTAIPMAMNAAGLRAFQNALAEQAKNKFVFHLRGKARATGRGDLHVEVVGADGRSLGPGARATLALAIAPAPRMPLLPSSVEDTDDHSLRRRIDAAAAYSGNAYLTGWLGFDAPTDDDRAFLLAAASELAAWLGDEVAIAITSKGAHPKEKRAFRAGDRLADRSVVARHFADEADVSLRRKSEGYDPAVVRVRHQPNGTTIFEPEMRAGLPRQPRIVPLDLSFSIRRAERERELAAAVAKLFDAALGRATCIGGFAAPTGSVLDEHAGTAYEILAGLWSRDSVDELRSRPRSPGWRVIVPKGRGHVDRTLEHVRATPGAAGVLLSVGGDDPFALDDEARRAMEAALLPWFATGSRG